MSSVTDNAGVWTRWLIRQETRGTGDLENAMRRAARKSGVSYWTLWTIWYRRAKRVSAETYTKLEQAVYVEKKRQLRLLESELASYEARTVLGERLHDAARNLGCEENQDLNSRVPAGRASNSEEA